MVVDNVLFGEGGGGDVVVQQVPQFVLIALPRDKDALVTYTNTFPDILQLFFSSSAS